MKQVWIVWKSWLLSEEDSDLLAIFQTNDGAEEYAKDKRNPKDLLETIYITGPHDVNT